MKYHFNNEETDYLLKVFNEEKAQITLEVLGSLKSGIVGRYDLTEKLNLITTILDKLNRGKERIKAQFEASKEYKEYKDYKDERPFEIDASTSLWMARRKSPLFRKRT